VTAVGVSNIGARDIGANAEDDQHGRDQTTAGKPSQTGYNRRGRKQQDGGAKDRGSRHGVEQQQ